MINLYRYGEKEIKEIKNNFVILHDTREQKNEHILQYFDDKKKKHIQTTIKTGDYSAKITAIPEIGIARDIYIPAVIEKKNSIDELAQSFKDRTRFESEFIRSQKQNLKIFLLVEDKDGYNKILKHEYRSNYDPKALLGSLKTFESRYNFTTNFINKEVAGNFIWYTLWYFTRELLS